MKGKDKGKKSEKKHRKTGKEKIINSATFY